MNKVLFVVIYLMFLFLADRPAWCDSEWTPAELGQSWHTIEVSRDKRHPEEGTFSLHYRSVYAGRNDFNPNAGAILFIPGGPGFIPWNWENDVPGFLKLKNKNVVFFHLRGTGYSQLARGRQALDKKFDKYHRWRFVLDDIERLRISLDLREWDLVYGHSHGALIAQLYAKHHRKHVKKLMLGAPPSRHQLTHMLFQERRQLALRVLSDIYRKTHQTHNLNFNEEDKISSIETRINYITQNVEKYFGTIDTILERGICENSTPDEPYDPPYPMSKEETERLRGEYQFLSNPVRHWRWYTCEFYHALRLLSHQGSASPLYQSIGYTIAGELLGEQLVDKLIKEHDPAFNLEIARLDLLLDLRAFMRTDVERPRGALRARYLFGVYDGLLSSFLAAKENFPQDLCMAMAHAGGSAGVNPFFARVTCDSKVDIEQWDPGKHAHDVPTLVIAGQADGISLPSQARHTFDHGLTGSRMLVLIPGYGHNLPSKVAHELKDLVESFLESRLKQDYAEYVREVQTYRGQLTALLGERVNGAFRAKLKRIFKDYESYMRRNIFFKQLPFLKSQIEQQLEVLCMEGERECEP